jgi:nitrogen PTS system EIIA component
MKSLLDAIQDGRLVELPDNNKEKTLEYLALLIEAVPDIGSRTDLIKAVKEREAQFNTGLGNGVAIPHIRTVPDGSLICAIGWSPDGIDYGAPDGKKVFLVIMYYIPESEKNLYLKEISGLAKVIKRIDVDNFFTNVKDIHTLRNKLLDWIDEVINEAVPDSRAKMVKLDVKQAALEIKQNEIDSLKLSSRIILFSLVIMDKDKFIVLSNNEKIVEIFEKSSAIVNQISKESEFDIDGYKIAVASSSDYSNGRKMYTGVAIKI